ncbi:MAG: MotA/TolQ/ExbB proton channel family protein [Bdellovibrionaceae bacterium]|nr:MotA/TolQ/ExbB proton channel family protein [Pseudobdellovibrionaceae bacterium]MBX3033274.1 MotA/TolQ/ExbB proton channel family protein [Pseudobdellovibrionaceae bacterium]
MLKEFGRIFIDHWYIMMPIAICSAAGIAIVVERALTLKAAGAVNKDELLKFIQAYCIQGQIQSAVSTVSQTKGPLANIVRAGLVAVSNGNDAEEVQTAMDAVALREIPRLNRRIDLLSALANVAVLLGLLGTVSGMIAAFGAVATLPPAEKAQVLASSIAEALNATGFGLLVSILLFAAWGWLNSWSAKVIDDVHEASVSTLNFILSNKSKIFKESGH